jgi:hypothetical protein
VEDLPVRLGLRRRPLVGYCPSRRAAGNTRSADALRCAVTAVPGSAPSPVVTVLRQRRSGTPPPSRIPYDGPEAEARLYGGRRFERSTQA